MGEAEPLPGILTFHFTLFVSLQMSGGFPCGATPLANGPRHCGQFWSVEVEAERATKGPSDRIVSAARYARIRSGQGWVFTVQGYADKAMAMKGSHVLRKTAHVPIGIISMLSLSYPRVWTFTVGVERPKLSPFGTQRWLPHYHCETRSRCRLTGTRYSFVWPGLETERLC